jgi:photosystem II stability/assembly factor-like uncharacterized protein
VAHSTDGGETWKDQHLTDESLTHLWGSGPRDVYVGGNSLYHSSDGGATWERQHRGAYGVDEISSLWGSGPRDVYAAMRSVVAHSTDGGAHWSVVWGPGSATYPTGSIVDAVFGTGPEDVYISAFWGDKNLNVNLLLLRSRDHGRTWDSTPGKIPGRFDAIAAAPDGSFYGVIYETNPSTSFAWGHVYVTRDAGASWTLCFGEHDRDGDVGAKGIAYGPAHQIMAYGFGGLATSTDDGAHWDVENLPKEWVGSRLRGAWTSPEGDMFAVGEDRLILRRPATR